MDIFQSEDDNEKEEQNQDQGQDNPSNDDQSKDNEDNKDENNDQETQASLDADYSVDEFNLDEQLSDVESYDFILRKAEEQKTAKGPQKKQGKFSGAQTQLLLKNIEISARPLGGSKAPLEKFHFTLGGEK